MKLASRISRVFSTGVAKAPAKTAASRNVDVTNNWVLQKRIELQGAGGEKVGGDFGYKKWEPVWRASGGRSSLVQRQDSLPSTSPSDKAMKAFNFLDDTSSISSSRRNSIAGHTYEEIKPYPQSPSPVQSAPTRGVNVSNSQRPRRAGKPVEYYRDKTKARAAQMAEQRVNDIRSAISY